ncbi:MAG: D-2-hydroxyacid dehydrogenase [Humibacillus sp.]|nr:D-2-hydroxyacid dehydrogenase [Humibacillus sp.]MDN5776439.1 D-2-hydroxyacid dehydrogenase [Humibacillus sp.]
MTRRHRPRLVVLTATDTPPPANLETLHELADVTVADAGGLAEALPGAEVLFLWDFFSEALQEHWDAADVLEWVHVAAAGVDKLRFPQLVDSGVIVTNSSGVFDRPIAEFVLAAILAHDKQFLRSRDLQREHRWKHRELTRTTGSKALVVGTGGIGRETARLLRAVGLAVRGVGRVARAEDPDFGDVVASDQLAAAVGWADHVVLAAPLTELTRRMVDEDVLRAMRSTAHLVNVGRGALVDQDAVVAALRDGRIAAATLDVFATEPLPPEHELWQLDNVALSAHMCGDVVGWRDELAAAFEDNLRRFMAAERLSSQVDLVKGYAPTS